MKPTIRHFLLETTNSRSLLNEMVIGEPRRQMISVKCKDILWRHVSMCSSDRLTSTQSGLKFIRRENSIIVDERLVGQDDIYKLVKLLSLESKECEALEVLNNWLIAVQNIRGIGQDPK